MQSARLIIFLGLVAVATTVVLAKVDLEEYGSEEGISRDFNHSIESRRMITLFPVQIPFDVFINSFDVVKVINQAFYVVKMLWHLFYFD